MHELVGELAALATAFCFATGSVLFTFAARDLGPLVLNRSRLVIAFLLVTTTHWITLGIPAPLHAQPTQWFWLGLSGIIGLVVGDLFLLQAYLWVGPRLTMLMMSMSPILATLLAWLFLQEALLFGQLMGIVITLVGIAWVVTDSNANHETIFRPENRTRGLLFGLGAATGQAIGLVLARQGLVGDFSPLSGNFIRLGSAILVIWGLAFIQGQASATIQRLRVQPQSLKFLLIGAFIAPFLGVSLSLLAIQQAEIGVASTLMALPPVFLLPVSFLVFKERFGWRSIVGTLTAMCGVAILFLA